MCTAACSATSPLAARQAAQQQQIQVSILAKQMSATKQQGQAVVQLIQAAATIGREAGKGTNFDAVG